jgi:hypothetical protein
MQTNTVVVSSNLEFRAVNIKQLASSKALPCVCTHSPIWLHTSIPRVPKIEAIASSVLSYYYKRFRVRGTGPYYAMKQNKTCKSKQQNVQLVGGRWSAQLQSVVVFTWEGRIYLHHLRVWGESEITITHTELKIWLAGCSLQTNSGKHG